jgi:hypothetical protein
MLISVQWEVIRRVGGGFYLLEIYVYMFDILALNFSHRIDHLSFGLPTPGLIQPLNGDLKIANSSKLPFFDSTVFVFHTFHRFTNISIFSRSCTNSRTN